MFSVQKSRPCRMTRKVLVVSNQQRFIFRFKIEEGYLMNGCFADLIFRSFLIGKKIPIWISPVKKILWWDTLGYWIALNCIPNWKNLLTDGVCSVAFVMETRATAGTVPLKRTDLASCIKRSCQRKTDTLAHFLIVISFALRRMKMAKKLASFCIFNAIQ